MIEEEGVRVYFLESPEKSEFSVITDQRNYICKDKDRKFRLEALNEETPHIGRNSKSVYSPYLIQTGREVLILPEDKNLVKLKDSLYLVKRAIEMNSEKYKALLIKTINSLDYYSEQVREIQEEMEKRIKNLEKPLELDDLILDFARE